MVSLTERAKLAHKAKVARAAQRMSDKSANRQWRDHKHVMTPTVITSAVLRQQCLRLRLQGFNYVEIGKKLRVSNVTAYQNVTEALRAIREETVEDAMKIKEFEVNRLDGILEKLWPRRADPRTADTILRLMDRRAKLVGLDAAQQSTVNVTGLEGLTDDQIAKRVESILESARARGVVEAEPGVAEKV